MAVTEDSGEFRYLPEQARKLGTTVPPAVRVHLELPDGRSLSGLRFGADDPEVTFLHGAGLNAHTWDAVALLLGRPAIAIDLPGHGDSSWREDLDYSPAALAAEVAAGLAAWTSRPQIFVGHSLGGLVAGAIAAEHPGLTDELFLVDITPGVDPEAAPTVLREFYVVTNFPTREDAVQRAMAFGFGGDRADTERGVFHNTRVRSDGRVEWKHHLAQLLGHSFDALRAGSPASDRSAAGRALGGWAALERLGIPITLIRAERGFLQPADVAEFSRRLPGASIVNVDAGHNIQETAPASLATLVTHALARPTR